jgi:predicted PurR-regulated permease PerM
MEASDSPQSQSNQSDQTNSMIENAIRLGIVAILLYAGIRIVAPFLDLIVWGIILAVALSPVHAWLMRGLGGSPVRAAIVITLACLVFVVVPSMMLGDALGSTAYELAGDLRDGSVEIPPPPSSVQDWPVIGGRVYTTWLQASTNIEALVARSSDQLVALGGQLLRAAGAAVVGMLQFAGSILVAGFFLARREASARAARDLFVRMAPEFGERLVRLTEQTVRGVAAGVLGVAIIQATLVGIGLLVAGVPYAGVWALLCLLLGIVQLPMGIIVVPLIVYEFMQASTTEAVIFLAYMVPVMLLDNVLKPILMGRGVETPMIVIFIGALGGFAASGFLGLFTGAIVLVVVYELFQEWLHGNVDREETPGPLMQDEPARS